MKTAVETLSQIKRDMLDHYEGDTISLDVNTLADLVNDVLTLRAALLGVEYVEHHITDEGSLEFGESCWTCPYCDGGLGLPHNGLCLVGNALKATA